LSQYLDNGQKAPSFLTYDFVIQYTPGHCSFLLNLENFTDTRQSKYAPLFTGTQQNPFGLLNYRRPPLPTPLTLSVFR
jgi:hypothetical protein